MNSMMASAESASSVEEVCERVQAGPLRVRGGGTMTALSTTDKERDSKDVVTIDLKGLCGIVEHDPSEFTITVLAGTSLRELDQVLAGAGQYLPCDPPLVDRGATVGGMVAGGLSGSGRYRFGGVRDFILGVRFVDGRGRVLRGGGKVVKNAAGFDLPKLMVGSLGSLGVLVEITLKVFPRPQGRRTLRVDCRGLEQGLEAMRRVGTGLDPEAVDVDSDGTLWLRMAGREQALDALVASVRGRFGGARLLPEDEAEALWKSRADLEPERGAGIVVKVPLTPARVVGFDEALGRDCTRRYVGGAQQAWIGWPENRPIDELSGVLGRQGLAGLAVLGEAPTFLGRPTDLSVAGRLKRVLDPEGRFRPL